MCSKRTTARSIAISKRAARELMQGLAALAKKHKVPILVQGMPAIFQTFFTDGPAPRNYREPSPAIATACSRSMRAAGRGHPRPSRPAKWFLSTAHDDAIIDETLAAADRAMAKWRAPRCRISVSKG